MLKFIAGSLSVAALSFALAGAPALAADADPTVAQIYDAAHTGHLDQAQQMIAQVLRDHPNSSKAHYVQAELYAREGNPGLARSELARAEQLDPGLSKENPRSVQELRAELGLIPRGAERLYGGASSGAHFPWGAVIILALVVGVFWLIFRRRTYYPAGPAPMAGPGGYGPGGYAGPGGGGYAGPAGGGVGSSIAGGLAGGLAAGAGIVAGEELAHHFLDGGQRAVPPPADDGSWGNASNPNPNADMGGSDFGVNDPSSWDDGSGGGGGDFGGGGGGGDDWT
ncbi:MAG TPA: hypothetical protein VME42_02455 [Steroidobacteraceae bacterium]|nr:hypothetical protein [Steroidobacteraceae bacterium]